MKMGTVELFFSIAGGLGGLATIYVYRNEIIQLLKKLCKLFNDVVDFLDFPRRMLASRINETDFLEWQDRMLLKIYGKDHFTTLFKRSYPVYCLQFNGAYDYNTTDCLCHDENTHPLLNSTNVKMYDISNTEIMKKKVNSDLEILMKRELMGNGWCWDGYKWFTKRSMRDGNHIGFTLHHLVLEGTKISKVHLSLGDYKLNVLTSHIMTYEFFKAYETLQIEAKEKTSTEKDRKKYLDEIELDRLWPMLPFRCYIHHKNGNDINEVLLNGKGRYSLLSVQCLVMLCSSNKGNRLEYKTFLGKRSSSTRKVSTKLGCYQFPPSGGFDLYDGKDIDSEIVESNCSLRWSLMREYLEEIFADDNFAKVDKKNKDDKTVMITKVEDDPRTRRIVDMLGANIKDNRFKEGTKQAYFSTVGANVDLIDLRLSVNFLLVINDYQYYLDGIKDDKNDDDKKKDSKIKYTFAYNEEVKADKKMLRSWKTVDEVLVDEKSKGKRNIVEDSVALYVQGKSAFRDYLDKVVADKSCIEQICND